MRSVPFPRFGTIGLGVAVSALALAACSKTPAGDTATGAPTAMETPATNDAMAPEAPPPAPPAADNTDTTDGSKLASYSGDAAKGEIAFTPCKTCHALDRNLIGPKLQGVVGRKAASIPGFTYSPAMQNSGITWTPEKLFQYLEKPQHVVPGSRMTYAGLSNPQQRADVIAYLKAHP